MTYAPHLPRWAGAAAIGVALGLFQTPAVAQTQDEGRGEIQASSEVAGAVVYPRGATIERRVSFMAPEGRAEIVIDDLPVDLEVDSLRVSGLAEGEGPASFEILGLSHKIREPRVGPLSDPERQTLLDRLEALKWERRAANDAVTEAQARIDYMAAFRQATVGRPPFPMGPQREKRGPAPRADRGGLFEMSGRWSEAWALIASESAAARQSLMQAERRRAAVDKDLAEVRDALDDVGPPPPARSVLTVSIRADALIAEGALSIEYLTRKASWAPLYDLRLDTAEAKEPGLDGMLTIARRAAVTQSTGEDWKGVTLRLSTARPTGRIEVATPRPRRAVLLPKKPPEPKDRARDDALSDLQDDFRNVERSLDQAEQQVLGGALQRLEVSPAPREAATRPRPASETTALAEYSGAGVVYEIEDPALIPGDGGARQVRIATDTAEVALSVRATPAKDAAAYLYALFKNVEAPLLPGMASIYRDGVFYGRFRLDQVAPFAEAALPFGPLDEVTVTHRIVTRSQGEEGLFTTSNRQQSKFELGAANLGTTPRRVTLFDVEPFTETEEIAIARSGTAPDRVKPKEIEADRGVHAWTFTLSPSEERKIPFSYDISWPEGRRMRLVD